MKHIFLTVVIVLGFVINSWGQEIKRTSLEKKYDFSKKLSTQDSIFTDTIQGFVNNGVNVTRTNTFIVEYDFKDGVYKRNNLRLKVLMPVAFKITNINRLAYDVVIKSKDSVLAETFIDDAVIAAIINSKEDPAATRVVNTVGGVVTNPKVAGFAYVVKGDIIDKKDPEKIKADLTENIPELYKLHQELTLNNKEVEGLKKKRDSLTNNFKNVTEADLSNQKLLRAEIIEKTEKEIKKIGESITTIEKKIKVRQDALDVNIRKFSDDNLALQTSFSRLNDMYNLVIKLKNTYQEVLTIAGDPYLSRSKYNMYYKDKITTKVDYISERKDSILRFTENYNDFNIKYSYMKYNPTLNELLNFGGQMKLYAQAEYLKELADGMNKYVIENNIVKMAASLSVLTKLLGEDSTYEVISAPIQPLNDLAVFEIIIKDNGEGSHISDKKSFRHREFTYGGVRLDFSLGLAGSIFSGTTVYELGSVLDTLGVRQTAILKKSNNLSVPSLLGLVTMSYRKTGYITYGASAGLGIDVVNGKIQLSNFFGGPTVLFGKFDRLFLTAGGTVRNVGQLKGGYQVGEILTDGSSDIDKFITDKYKIGFFIALTYNLTRGARDNYKKIKSL